MSRVRDSQRQKCYNWESKEFHGFDGVTELSFKEYVGEEDPQVVSQRVFNAWRRERYGTQQGYLTLAQCQKLVDRSWRRWAKRIGSDSFGYPFDVPRVADGRGRRVACYDGRIKLPLWARTPRTVLHEAAHAINETMAGRKRYTIAAHGAEFMYIVTDLYAWHYDRPVGGIRRSARVAGLKVRKPLTQIIVKRSVTKSKPEEVA